MFENDMDGADSTDLRGLLIPIPGAKDSGLSLSCVFFGLTWTTMLAEAVPLGAIRTLAEICSWALPAAISMCLSLERGWAVASANTVTAMQ